MWINRILGGINMGDQYDYYSYVLEDNYLADMEMEYEKYKKGEGKNYE